MKKLMYRLYSRISGSEDDWTPRGVYAGSENGARYIVSKYGKSEPENEHETRLEEREIGEPSDMQFVSMATRSEADHCVICGYSFAAEWPRQCRRCGDYVCLSCLDEDGLCEFCGEREERLDEIQ